MKRRIASFIVFALIYLAAILLAKLVYSYIDYKDRNPSINHRTNNYVVQDCQYPVRNLNTDGGCDNSDPGCPENIKLNGGYCLEPQITETKYETISGK